jgi:hypothetical protein
MPLGIGMVEEIKLVKVEYYRQVKPPTLKQFLYRRAVQKAMEKVKGKTGVTLNPENGIPIPQSALAAKEALKGLTAEQILAEHPEWEQEYYEKYPEKT